ncbi:MAG TPA: leucyl/phenylalanyl-tRNA--protein transferase [Actinomycetes bacterium]|nr:leucyl/phenylalanyl-tRNA--protein transferase [Actinomycetes bacterium]
MASRAPLDPGPSRWQFPDPASAGADGVVGLGADLDPATLVQAYRRGIFPWPHPGMPLPWFSPDPRGVLPLDGLRLTRSLRQRLRRCGWEATVDRAFEAVIGACAQRGDEGTWITPQMRAAYTLLHELCWAHSVEVWDGDTLVGGLYGVQVGGVFTGESMFHRVPDASKVALVDLAARLRAAGGSLIDVQITTEHLAGFGAQDLARARFLEVLAQARGKDVRLPVDRLPVDRLAADPATIHRVRSGAGRRRPGGGGLE